MATDSALLFDLGGTHLRCACLTGEGEIGNITRERIRSFRDGLSPAEIWEELLGKIVTYTTVSESLIEKSAPLVISFPGPLQEDGRIVNAPTLSGNDSKIPDIGAELSQRTGRVVHILNDVSAAALYLARGGEWDRFIVVTVSSGIARFASATTASSRFSTRGPMPGRSGISPSMSPETHLVAIAAVKDISGPFPLAEVSRV